MQTETSDTTPGRKVFLMLQGPHGPFFWSLGRMLRRTGSEVWRVGFNAGDRAFWFSPGSFLPYTGQAEDWPDRFEALVREKGVTDIVLYGDTRPVHALATDRARALGLTVHVFEEGYIRPYWVTYERDGSNGNSMLMHLSVQDMRTALEKIDLDPIEPPPQWGEMRQHIFYGALYHWFVMFRNGAFRHYKGHRELPVSKEFLLYFKRLVLMPRHHLSREWHTRRILASGFPFHIALLQLEHDTSFQVHSPYTTMPEFIADVIAGFASGAPAHHHLVFKAHPLENDRRNLTQEVRRIAAEHGVPDRVHYVRGGKLKRLLHMARSAVTVNSTAGQQVLALGLPLKVFGRAVYDKPEFVSHQPLDEFFSRPVRPDRRAYRDYRQFLLESSQIPGGFYSKRGRRQLMRVVVDLMLAPEAPDTALLHGTAQPRQPLRLRR
ncbi:capsule biosynthesis protein [Celeribacter indicus]|uniref:Capsular polysaccharide export protein KpsS n=1 Tax=Celeribacter indicus TaxID=1208324 RepID=A0A0B5DX35_9RHOB|nr:capsular biosynthesis protein [Celeribacter indicus]AJE48018.1 capsular polysaccharide export protein KpsS [Celeribacter indicus]SDW29620.1 capsular polysaccharide export protein [Celeribacter indicus]